MTRPTRENLEEEVNHIPLKNLPTSGLTQYEYKKVEEGEDTPADNVLIGAIGNLTEVSLVGRTKDGGYYFASSHENLNNAVTDIEAFAELLKEENIYE